MPWAPLRRLCGVTVAACAVVGAMLAGPAEAQTQLPVNYNFISGFLSGFGSPDTAPPGANPLLCWPSAQHPHPVISLRGLDRRWSRAPHRATRPGSHPFRIHGPRMQHSIAIPSAFPAPKRNKARQVPSARPICGRNEPFRRRVCSPWKRQPSPNIASPQSTMRRCPRRSPVAPAASNKAASGTEYAVTAHDSRPPVA